MIELIQRHLEDIIIPGRCSSRIVVKHIDPSIGIRHRLKGAFHRFRIADIDPEKFRFSSILSDFLTDFFSSVQIDVDQAQRRSFAGKKQSTGFPDSGRGSGDDRNFAFKPFHGILLFLREIMNASCYKPMEAIGKSIDGSFIEQECIESQKPIILEN